MNELVFDFLFRYQGLGWHLTPCNPKDKAPTLLGQGGWYNATPESGAWMSWQRTFKNCLWGVRPVDFCVLDSDVKHGGVKLLDELIAKHGALPKTPTVRTGGGGRHYYFACDESVKSRHIQSCEGLEIITLNKGVILPPSIHPDTGVPYAWEIAPWECEMARIPAWLLSEVKTRSPEAKANETRTPDDCEFVWSGGGFDTLGDLPEGGRNKPIADAIVAEKLAGTSEEECLSKALAWASRFVYDKGEMMRKITSIYGNPNFVARDTSLPPRQEAVSQKAERSQFSAGVRAVEGA